MSQKAETLLAVRDLKKIYQVGSQTVPAVNGIDLDILKGEYVAIMGSSGSGKSTLMNMLGCLDTPTSGSYEMNGTEVKNFTDDQLAGIRNKEIGFVFQTFNLLPRSNAIQNVELPLVYAGLRSAERKARVIDALQKVGLGDRMDHRPNELSGGQRQRVAVARALVNNPSLILADEPTGNLDSVTSDEIMDLLKELNDKGHTVIVVTHEEDIAAKCKRIIRLHDGKIISDSDVILA